MTVDRVFHYPQFWLRDLAVKTKDPFTTNIIIKVVRTFQIFMFPISIFRVLLSFYRADCVANARKVYEEIKNKEDFVQEFMRTQEEYDQEHNQN